MPRGSAKSFDETPDYVIRMLLSGILVKDAGEVRSLSADDRYVWFREVFAIEGTIKVPYQQIPLLEYGRYMHNRWVEHGRIGEAKDLSEGFDFQKRDGAVSLICPPDADPEDLVKQMRCNRTGEVRDVPQKWEVRIQDVGVTWFLEKNWSIKSVTLDNPYEQETHGLYAQFRKERRITQVITSNNV